jgi:hypothetical protein
MSITLNLILPPVFTIDIGPHLQQVGANLVALFDDLQAKLTDLQTTAADEHTQVMTARGGRAGVKSNTRLKRAQSDARPLPFAASSTRCSTIEESGIGAISR